MKLVDMTCPRCGAALQLNVQSKQAYCSYCGALLIIDVGVQHIQFDNAEKAGYEFEKGRQRAQAETGINPAAREGSKKKKKRTWLWALGWIFIFPVPLTVLMVRNGRIKPVPEPVRQAAATAVSEMREHIKTRQRVLHKLRSETRLMIRKENRVFEQFKYSVFFSKERLLIPEE